MASTDTQSKATKQDAGRLIAAANATFVDAYAAGESQRAVTHYDDEAIWYLTNGTPLLGRDAIASFLDGARAQGAGRFALEGRALREVGAARYTTERFQFELAPQREVRGTRYGLWVVNASDARLVRDAWVPDTPAPRALAEQIEQRTQALAAAYNGADADALRAFYAANATVVLSNGSVFSGDAVGPMLSETAARGITDMRMGPQQVIAAGEAAYSIGSFDLTLPTPDGGVPLSGERLFLWRDAGAGWQVVLELSWPRSG